MGIYNSEVHGLTYYDDSGQPKGILLKVPDISGFVEEYYLPKVSKEVAIGELGNMSPPPVGCPKAEGWQNECEGNHQWASAQVTLNRGELKAPTKSGAKAGQPRDPAVEYNYKFNFVGFGTVATTATVTTPPATPNVPTAPTGAFTGMTDGEINTLNVQLGINDRTALMQAVEYSSQFDVDCDLRLTVADIIEVFEEFAEALNSRAVTRTSPLVKDAQRLGATEVGFRPAGEPARVLSEPQIKNRAELDEWVKANSISGDEIKALLLKAGFENSQAYMAENFEGGIQGLADFIYQGLK